MKHIIGISILATCTAVQATSIFTDFGGDQFNPGFTPGTPSAVDVSDSPVTVGTGFTATFNDGLAVQGSANGGLYDGFFGPGNASNTGNNAAFFVLNNGGAGVQFTSIPNNPSLFVDTIDVASVTFNQAVSNVSFAFQILGNGPSSAVQLLDINGVIIDSIPLIETDTDRDSIATFTQISIDTTGFKGGEVFGIQFNNAGPASPVPNPPYGIAVDSFSATAVPEPSAALLAGLALGIPFLRRRR